LSQTAENRLELQIAFSPRRSRLAHAEMPEKTIRLAADGKPFGKTKWRKNTLRKIEQQEQFSEGYIKGGDVNFYASWQVEND
jgi:hypothetical protein